MDRLKGKVAIVTGSTSGIGIGIAKLFAAEGAKVVICGRREEKGQAVVDEIKKDGGEASYHFMDITVTESIEKLFADTAEKYGKIDILVNNAANVALKDGRVDELTLEIEGLNMDAVWDNFIIQVGGLEITQGNSLEEQIALDERKAKLTKEIEKLEKQARKEKQPNKKFQLAQQAKNLKAELEDLYDK